MQTISWNKVKKDLLIKAKPDGGYWTLAVEFVQGPLNVKIEAEGGWSYADEDDAACGPDGDHTSYVVRDMCVNPNAPVGTLVGKLGGSTADKEGSRSFVVGRFCIVSIGKEDAGPLYLTMNDLPTGYDDNLGEMTVQIWFGANIQKTE